MTRTIAERCRLVTGHPRALVAATIIALCAGVILVGVGAWIPLKAAAAQALLQRAWNASNDDTRHARPWPWADTWPVARLDLPTASSAFIVLSGASGRNLAFGPALTAGSVLPGEPGVSLIAGHRDTHFGALRDLKAGQRFAVERTDGTIFTYRVKTIEVVDATRTVIRLDADESLVALVTCYPFDAPRPGGDLRLVVVGELI